MSPLDRLHEQHETDDGEPVLFECTECGFRSQSLGTLHAHVEGHWSLLASLRWHVTHLFRDEPAKKWMESTQVVIVRETERGSIEDVAQ